MQQKSISRNYPFIIMFKIILILYLMIKISGYFVSNTDAYYIDQKQTSGKINIGTWESKEKVQQKTDVEIVEKFERNPVVSDDSKYENTILPNEPREETEVEATTQMNEDEGEEN